MSEFVWSDYRGQREHKDAKDFRDYFGIGLTPEQHREVLLQRSKVLRTNLNTKREKGKKRETSGDSGCWCGNCGSIHPDEINAVTRIRELEEEVRRLTARVKRCST